MGGKPWDVERIYLRIFGERVLVKGCSALFLADGRHISQSARSSLSNALRLRGALAESKVMYYES